MSHAAFVRAICAEPGNLTPRLVFADWLDEQGSDRDRVWAEFIRTQCQLVQTPIDNPAWLPLHLRGRALVARWGKGWLGPIRQHLRRWSFRCGFVESITVYASTFVAHADEIVAATPVRQIRLLAVHVVNWSDLLALLARLRIPRLDLRHEPITGPMLETLFRSQLAPHLTALGLRGTGVSNNAGVQRLADCETLTNLTELDLSDERINATVGGAGLDRYDVGQTDDYWDFRRAHAAAAIRPLDLQRFAESESYPHLTAVSLANHGAGAARGLADTPLLDRLEALDLSGSVIADAELFRSPVCRRLRILNLARIFAGNAEGVRRVISAVASSYALDGLRILDFSGLNSRHGLHLHVAQLLARGSGLAQLAILRLAGSQVDVDGAAALARADWPNWRQLDLNENFLGDRGVAEVCTGAWISQLQALHLSGPGTTLGRPESSWLTDAGATRLAQAPFQALLLLDASYHRISAEGLASLAATSSLSTLQVLRLTGNDSPAPNDFRPFLAPAAWPQLSHLDLSGGAPSATTMAHLRARFGVGVRYGLAPVAEYRPAHWPADDRYDKYSDTNETFLDDLV